MSQQERDQHAQQAQQPQQRQEVGGKYTAVPVRAKVCRFSLERVTSKMLYFPSSGWARVREREREASPRGRSRGGEGEIACRAGRGA